MKPLLRLMAATVAGLLLGAMVNSGVLAAGVRLLPPPDGVDMGSMAGLQAAMPHLPASHLLAPWLAHALGTFCGAWLASRLVPAGKWQGALLVGLAFLAGGVMMAWQLPAPRWFELADIALAYLPVAGLGHLLAQRARRPRAKAA